MMTADQMTQGDKETLASLGLQRIQPGAGESEEVKRLKKDIEKKNEMYDEESKSKDMGLMFAMDL